MPEVIVYIDDILVIKNLRGSSSSSCTPSAESPCR
jgi:hypothetical protein